MSGDEESITEMAAVKVVVSSNYLRPSTILDDASQRWVAQLTSSENCQLAPLESEGECSCAGELCLLYPAAGLHGQQRVLLHLPTPSATVPYC